MASFEENFSLGTAASKSPRWRTGASPVRPLSLRMKLALLNAGWYNSPKSSGRNCGMWTSIDVFIAKNI